MSSKEDKLKAISEQLSEEEIDIIYKKHIINKNKVNKDGKYIVKKNKVDKEKKPTKIIDKTTEKYKILLKFINKILVNIDKDEINNLTQFVNVDRLDIIKPENKVILDEMAKELFIHFNKKKCSYYKKTNNIVTNCIRGMCKEAGLTLVRQKKSVYEKLYTRAVYLYTIKNI